MIRRFSNITILLFRSYDKPTVRAQPDSPYIRRTGGKSIMAIDIIGWRSRGLDFP